VIRRQLVGAALTLVVIAVMGLLYLQTVAESRATREAWALTRDVTAGTQLGNADVNRIRIPAVGDQFALLDGSPLGRRASHRMGARTLLTGDDLLSDDTVLVPVSVRVAPAVVAGDTLDVYAVVGARTVLVGRRLIVAGAGNPMTFLVSAADEPNWVALEANNVSLFAAKSTGVGVPANPAVAVGDAISSLSGTSPAPTPRPSPR
jgi:hypothetical protein